MGRDIYKVGDESSTGHKIKTIIGQSPSACVYTTECNELRWSYYENKGKLPEMHGHIVLQFDMLMYKIKDLDISKAKKRNLYMLLGKQLFIGLNSDIPASPDTLFNTVEAKIESDEQPKDEKLNHIDVVIICALHDPELTAVLNLSDWISPPPNDRDPQTYHYSTWNLSDNEVINIVAAAPNHMGLVCSGVLAAKMIWKFKPKLVAIVGIAAGVKSKIQGFGDILAPEHTFDYGASKTVKYENSTKDLPSPHPLAINPKLLGRLKEWQKDRRHLDDISHKWPAQSPNTKLNMHIGPMFSSPKVLDTKLPIEEIISHTRKLIGVEMEAHAVHRASNDTLEPMPKFLCFKSICDFAENKNDNWQHYAAFTSAELLKKFLVTEWSVISK